jgi:UMF1 family MFS transporter
VAWSLWDWGSSGFAQITLTFVFTVYLTGAVGDDLPEATAALAYGTGVAGLLIALLAPVIGQRADASGRRKRSTGFWTALLVLTIAATFFVRDDYSYLLLGVILLGLASIFYELASVSYTAMLVQVSTPANMGRVSGFGWAMGYVGGIILLVVAYFGFISGDDPDLGGLLGLPVADGFNIRVVEVVAAVWFAVFALPLFFSVPEIPPDPNRPARMGVVASYRKLIADLREMYRSTPHTLWFLLSSALYRDGLNAVFALGAVLAVTVYGISAGDVLIFGIAANVVSAAGAFAGGFIEDRVGPKPVIMVSLLGLVATGLILLFLEGPLSFWVLGLVLSLFTGPAQSSSRTFLARLAPVGKEGELFGLYATTGRAVSFLAPTLFGLFVTLFGTQRAGIVGILIVLVAGAVALWPVRPPQHAAAAQQLG